MRVLLVLTAAATFAFACSNAGDPGFDEDATGFACSNTVVSFDSDGCNSRIASSKCKDGGFEVRDAGTTTQLCCTWQHCFNDPFPEYH
jgi:hypothetical protein